MSDNLRPAAVTIRADLHVHSLHSGFTSTLPMFRSRDCYSTPAEIHQVARARGMDVVTITDHDSIDGCLEFLDRHPDSPDFLIGEEIECRAAGIRAHVGAFGMTEALHRDVQPLRGDVREVAGFLRSQGVALVLHHPFHFFRGEVHAADYLEQLLPLVHAVEVRNGTMLPAHNQLAEILAGRWRGHRGVPLGETGGSDAHVLCHVGDSYTVVRDGFTTGRASAPAPRDLLLDALRAGAVGAGGLHGTAGRFAFEIYGVIFNYWGGLLGMRSSGLSSRERAGAVARSVLSLPFQLAPLVVSLAQKAGERRRTRMWRRELADAWRRGAGCQPPVAGRNPQAG